MTGWAARALDLLAQGQATAMVSVVAVEGSTPREAGARMLVTPEARFGTIGGGRLEHLAEQQARLLLAQGERRYALQDYPLGVLLAQCCGGFVRILVERLDPSARPWLQRVADACIAGGAVELETSFGDVLSRTVRPAGAAAEPRFLDSGGQPLTARRPKPAPGDRLVERIDAWTPRVAIFGAGHVGQALRRQFDLLPFFRLSLLDTRPEMAADGLAEVVSEGELVARAAGLGPEDYALILTHDHGLDYRLTRAVLGAGVVRYCGLIGSATKRARFLSRLRTDGLADGAIARLTCPIGLRALTGKNPEIIALGVAAELMLLRQAHAAERTASIAV